MRRIVALLLAGILLFLLGLNCKDAPKDQKDEKGDTVIQETLPPKDTPGDTTETDTAEGESAEQTRTKAASPLPDTIDKPEGDANRDL